MGYLIHKKNIKLYKQKKLIILLISMFIFSLLYYKLGREHYNKEKNYELDYFDSLYLSIVTQALLGPGDISPKTDISRVIVSIQVLVTVFITFVYISE